MQIHRAPRFGRVPKGCDQQGRYTQAAEAATDVGQDDDGITLPSWLPAAAVLVVALVSAASYFYPWGFA